MKIALIGDYNESVAAHRAIPIAINLSSKTKASYTWLRSDQLRLSDLTEYQGVWCVPASPYANMNNVLMAIHYARTQDIPFLGTCGGYQHAALEYAINVLGYTEAGNAEVDPNTSMPLISCLVCQLYDVEASIHLQPGSFVQGIYGQSKIYEDYFCGFGVNPDYLRIYEGSGLSFSGTDDQNDPRVLEIRDHRFFVGTAFQPERSALRGCSHPLIEAFISSASTR